MVNKRAYGKRQCPEAKQEEKMTSPPGARLPKEYMRFGHRNVNFKKCVVCGKALHSNNKSGLCSSDSHAEYVLNYKEQGFYKS